MVIVNRPPKNGFGISGASPFFSSPLLLSLLFLSKSCPLPWDGYCQDSWQYSSQGKILLLNAKGLNIPEKRRILLKDLKYDAAFIQETHFRDDKLPILKNRYYPVAYHCITSLAKTKGVSILPYYLYYHLAASHGLARISWQTRKDAFYLSKAW